MSHITNITDHDLIRAIQSAQQRVTFIAPGLWPKVADALSDAWKSLGKDAVSVILDVDPEVCRLGYGIICDRAIAIRLGQQFRQNAIFSVYDNTVNLINCTPPHKDIPCGKWSDLLD